MFFKKKPKKVSLYRELNPEALQDLYDCCLTAQGLYEFVKSTGDHRLLPGYSSCVWDLKKAIEKAEKV